MVIHFFTNRGEARIDFRQLLDKFFPSIPNTEIKSDDDAVTVTINDPLIDFQYGFKITKRNTLRSIYTLNKDYIYTNMFIDIPTLIPSYLDKRILQVVDELCKTFKMAIYHEYVKDIVEFHLLDVLGILYENKHRYIANNDIEGYFMHPDHVYQAFSYLHAIPLMESQLPNEVNLPSYEVFYDKGKHKALFSMTWVKGSASIIPPVLDYVIVEEEDNLTSLVPFPVFMKYASHFVKEWKAKDGSNVIDGSIYYLSERSARSLGHYCKKMRKAGEVIPELIPIKITDIIEKE